MTPITLRRVALALVATLAAALAAGIATSSSRGAGGPYTVRAIFDDAAYAVTGEDVRIAGAPVGTITSLAVTPDNKAAVTMSINNAGFIPFHANATCAIRPQSLIGEEYVDCDPGTSAAPALVQIANGSGAGSYLLPVTQTSSPINTDIVQDIYQQPVREALAVIIDEFGTGLAARGSDLNAVIHRANPALGYTDQLFKILARQNHTLAQLATDGDAVLAPLAQDRTALADFIRQANTTSVASAARAADIQRTFALFPSFLAQLRPLMADLGSLASQGTPLMNQLGQSASALTREFTALTPFAGAARTALINLGNASARSQPSLVASESLAGRLLKLGNATAPTAASLDRLTSSLQRTGAIQKLMALLFNAAVSVNGFDKLGHYARTQLLAGSPDCVQYALAPVSLCSANFGGGGSAASAASAASVTRAAAPLKGLLDYLIGGRG